MRTTEKISVLDEDKLTPGEAVLIVSSLGTLTAALLAVAFGL